MRIGTRLIVLVAAAAIAAGCGSDSKTGPSRLVAIQITGPTQITPTASVSYKATGRFNDGTSKDYTTLVTWTTVDPSVISVDVQGLATAHSAGESVVTASVIGISGTINVLVLPAGTFRLTGTVTSGGAPLQGAAVVVTSGTGTGLSATTDNAGRYRLYGVAGFIGLQVTKLGYLTATQSLGVGNQATADFALFAGDALPNVAGVYSLVITASQPCRFSQGPALPDDLKTRRYNATVTQNGTQLQVVLSGATFLTKNGLGNGFTAQLTPAGLTFELGDGYYTPYPDLIESLTGSTALLITGSGTMSAAGATLVGTINGDIDVVRLPLYQSNDWYVSICDSIHQISMTPAPATARRR